MTHVEVDVDACCGAGMCTLLAPEVFDQNDDGTVVLLDRRPPAARWEEARQAAQQCPCSAITVHDDS